MAARGAGSAADQESASTATWPQPLSEDQQHAAAAKAADHMAQLLMVCTLPPWSLDCMSLDCMSADRADVAQIMAYLLLQKPWRNCPDPTILAIDCLVCRNE